MPPRETGPLCGHKLRDRYTLQIRQCDLVMQRKPQRTRGNTGGGTRTKHHGKESAVEDRSTAVKAPWKHGRP